MKIKQQQKSKKCLRATLQENISMKHFSFNQKQLSFKDGGENTF